MLILDILPGEGCGGFVYEFRSSKDAPENKYLLLNKNNKTYFAVNKENLIFFKEF